VKPKRTYLARFDGHVFGYETTRELSHAVIGRGNYEAMLDEAGKEAARIVNELRPRMLANLKVEPRQRDWRGDPMADWQFFATLTPQQHFQYALDVAKSRVYGMLHVGHFQPHVVSWHKHENAARTHIRNWNINSPNYVGGQLVVVPVTRID
jgi:hypothetical protein